MISSAGPPLMLVFGAVIQTHFLTAASRSRHSSVESTDETSDILAATQATTSCAVSWTPCAPLYTAVARQGSGYPPRLKIRPTGDGGGGAAVFMYPRGSFQRCRGSTLFGANVHIDDLISPRAMHDETPLLPCSALWPL